MQIENLNHQNVEDLKAKLESMRVDNANIEYKAFPMDEKPPTNDQIYHQLLEVEKRVEELHEKIAHIFDGHVLINGSFVKIDVNAG